MKKQQKRKEKEKAKQRKRAAPEKVSVAPSTLGGRVGEMVDRYRKMTVKEYNDVVELCHMHGVQLSKGVLGRGGFVFKGRHKRGDYFLPLAPATSRVFKFYRVNWPFSLQNLIAVTNFGPCD